MLVWVVQKLKYIYETYKYLAMEKLSIKDWYEDDRPREKLLLKGKEHLSNAELLAIVLRIGGKNESALELAKRLLATVDNDLQKLAQRTVAELMQLKGIGEAKAISLISALELGKRRIHEEVGLPMYIKSASDVMRVMAPKISDLNVEEFWVLYVNNSNKILMEYLVSRGGLTATLVDIRLIIKHAVALNAIGIVLCHNHPSGRVSPSTADKQFTTKVKEACKLLDLRLLDHVIVAEKLYFSFADEGLL